MLSSVGPGELEEPPNIDISGSSDGGNFIERNWLRKNLTFFYFHKKKILGSVEINMYIARYMFCRRFRK